MPIPAEAVSTARDATGLSSALEASVGREVRRRSVWSACTFGNVEPTCLAEGGGQPTRTSSEVPSRLSSSTSNPAPVFPSAPNNRPRVRQSTSGASTSPSSFSAPPSAPNRATRRRSSCSVLAMCSITQRSGRPGASAVARPGLLSSTERRGTAADGTSCDARGTPTKWGRARWVRRARAGAARKSSKNA
ncbi:hypothetical protein EDB89DRAFT_586120 [Lactarius sanguifluus]|nr:hypothetical protein EDB89DRAFT_586120 [Lactarius sanguifluus]